MFFHDESKPILFNGMDGDHEGRMKLYSVLHNLYRMGENSEDRRLWKDKQ